MQRLPNFFINRLRHTVQAILSFPAPPYQTGEPTEILSQGLGHFLHPDLNFVPGPGTKFSINRRYAQLSILGEIRFLRYSLAPCSLPLKLSLRNKKQPFLIVFEGKFRLSYTKNRNPTLSSNADVQRAHRGQCRKCRIKHKIIFSASSGQTLRRHYSTKKKRISLFFSHSLPIIPKYLVLLHLIIGK